jgi:hypothetical protein
LTIPVCQSSGIGSISDIAVKSSVRELVIESPPYFRKSFGISSTPGALPDFNDRVTEMDSLLNTTGR